MPSLHQFQWDHSTFQYGADNVMKKVTITGAPNDADWSRWGMACENNNRRLYCFKGRSRDSLYSFSWNDNSLTYRYVNNPTVLSLMDIPTDTDMSSFGVLYEDSNWRFYFKRLGSPVELYCFSPVEHTNQLRMREGNMRNIPIIEFPPDADHCRWFMYDDGDKNIYGCLVQGKPGTYYSGALSGREYRFNEGTQGILTFGKVPDKVGFQGASLMKIYSGFYRFYLMEY